MGAEVLRAAAMRGDVSAEIPLDDVSEFLAAFVGDFSRFVPDGAHAEGAHGGLTGRWSSWFSHEVSLPTCNTEMGIHPLTLASCMLFSYYRN